MAQTADVDLSTLFSLDPAENRRLANLKYFVDPLLRLAVQYRMDEEIMWKISNAPWGLFRAYILCSDLFAWGLADSEAVLVNDIPKLAKAFEDCEKVDAFNTHWGTWLYCCRKRGMRPQGAAYTHIDPALWSLFDATGPERRVDAVNPYEPGDYDPIEVSDE